MSSIEDPVVRLGFVAFVVVFGLIALFFGSLREPRAPIAQDVMDGTYVNQDCPSFQIKNALLSFDGGQVQGKISEKSIGVTMEIERGVGFEITSSGCRLKRFETGQFLYPRSKGSERVIGLPSQDKSAMRYWRRVSSSERLLEGLER